MHSFGTPFSFSSTPSTASSFSTTPVLLSPALSRSPSSPGAPNPTVQHHSGSLRADSSKNLRKTLLTRDFIDDLTVPKHRRPRFELKLTIHDLNNVPLTTGSSYVKWHVSGSTKSETRGQTPKANVKDHKVFWNYNSECQVRMTIDRNGTLSETNIVLKVIQEFDVTREQITLGYVTLNLAEYVGVGSETRRYLMMESKVNSTLKVTVQLIQVSGDTSFQVPRLKSAHIFGAITGVINEHAPSTGSNGSEGDNNSLSGVQQTRYTTSLQEMYRSTLTSQWNLTGEELNPEDCIEDIFRGGNGWKTGTTSAKFKDSRRVKDAEQKSISSSDPEAESLTLQVPKIRPPTQASTPTPHDMSSVPIILNRQPSASSLSNASGLSIPSSTRSTKSDRSLQLPTARSSRSNSSATSDRERRRRAHLEDMPGHGYGSMLAPRGNGGSHGFWMGERTAEVSRMKTGRSITRERVNGRCGELEESELTGGDLRSWFHQS